ncbi:hypothetical protein M427DRAFT_29214 [Gonapodya prolifera JEL478]|uniref:Uncharacterized protein n=1 Tax=Gonapodya prolifera (strain JEL478) TaxID=1344416 RepID=A0A139ARC6_GONPJ|nr:hypothetical protein M427DRAFT_29214 [Gonapodya prolifera JEL478]|eukprot:KXS19279.1 hypothetical protein M427DRAFT_29214 [Gonapodya prolifera JEL478]
MSIETRILAHVVSRVDSPTSNPKPSPADRTCLETYRRTMWIGTAGAVAGVGGIGWRFVDTRLVVQQPRKVWLFALQLASVSSLAFLTAYHLSRYASATCLVCLVRNEKTPAGDVTREAVVKWHPKAKEVLEAARRENEMEAQGR